MTYKFSFYNNKNIKNAKTLTDNTLRIGGASSRAFLLPSGLEEGSSRTFCHPPNWRKAFAIHSDEIISFAL